MAEKHQELLLKNFIAEAEEIIEAMDQHLFLLDSGADGSSAPPETLHSLFRSIHTLKGAAGMVGLSSVSDLSHRMEDMLDKLRLGKLALSREILDILNEGTNQIRKLLKQSGAAEDNSMDIRGMMGRIEQALGGNAPADGESNVLHGLDSDIMNTLTEYETHRLAENIRSGARVYEIRALFKVERFDKDLNKILKQIKPFGEVITSVPGSGLSPDAGILFKIIVGSKHTLEEKKIKWAGEEVEIRKIDVSRTAGPSKEILLPEHGVPGTPDGSSAGERSESIKSMTQTVRVDIGKLDALMNIVGELVLNKSVIQQMVREMLEKEGFSDLGLDIQKSLENISRKIGELQENLINVRMTPVGQIFDRLIRMVKKISREINKPVNLHISGEDTALDKTMVEAVADPLMHLIRNAIDHGIETPEERLKAGKSEEGLIYLRAFQKGNQVQIEVEDDGAGINLQAVYRKAIEKKLADPNKEYSPKELIDFIFLPGFSTSQTVTDLSGRGVGLDVVARNISKLSGMAQVNTIDGKGTKFTITLPITLIIIRALLVRIGEEEYAVPLNSVSESLIIDRKDLKTIDNREVIQLREHTISLLRLEDLFGLKRPAEQASSLYVIIIGSAEKRMGLIVDDIIDQQEVVIKSLGSVLGTLPGIAGAAELGNKKTVLVLDVAVLMDEVLGKNNGK